MIDGERRDADQGAGEIESLPPRLRPLPLELPDDERDHGEAERHGDEEDAPPAEMLGENPSRDGTDRQADVDRRRRQPERPSPFGGGNDGGHDRDTGGEGHRGADPLQHPERDEQQAPKARRRSRPTRSCRPSCPRGTSFFCRRYRLPCRTEGGIRRRRGCTRSPPIRARPRSSRIPSRSSGARC